MKATAKRQSLLPAPKTVARQATLMLCSTLPSSVEHQSLAESENTNSLIEDSSKTSGSASHHALPSAVNKDANRIKNRSKIIGLAAPKTEYAANNKLALAEVVTAKPSQATDGTTDCETPAMMKLNHSSRKAGSSLQRPSAINSLSKLKDVNTVTHKAKASKDIVADCNTEASNRAEIVGSDVVVVVKSVCTSPVSKLSLPKEASIHKQQSSSGPAKSAVPKFGTAASRLSRSSFEKNSADGKSNRGQICNMSRTIAECSDIKTDSTCQDIGGINSMGNSHLPTQVANADTRHMQAFSLDSYKNTQSMLQRSAEPPESAMSSPVGSTCAMPDLIATPSSLSSRNSRLNSLESCCRIDGEPLVSSDGSLGVLNDTDLLNSSLLPADHHVPINAEVIRKKFEDEISNSVNMPVEETGDDSFSVLMQKISSLGSSSSLERSGHVILADSNAVVANNDFSMPDKQQHTQPDVIVEQLCHTIFPSMTVHLQHHVQEQSLPLAEFTSVKSPVASNNIESLPSVFDVLRVNTEDHNSGDMTTSLISTTLLAIEATSSGTVLDRALHEIDIGSLVTAESGRGDINITVPPASASEFGGISDLNSESKLVVGQVESEITSFATMKRSTTTTILSESEFNRSIETGGCQVPGLRVITATPSAFSDISSTGKDSENCISCEQISNASLDTEGIEKSDCREDPGVEAIADNCDVFMQTSSEDDEKLNTGKQAEENVNVENVASVQSSMVQRTCDTSSPKTKSLAKTGPVAKLFTNSSRRPSAPVMATAEGLNVQTERNTVLQKNVPVMAKQIPTLCTEPPKLTGKQFIRGATRASVDLGQSQSKDAKPGGLAESVDNKKLTAMEAANAARRRGPMAWGKSSLPGCATPPRSKPSMANQSALRTSTPVSGNGSETGRCSQASGDLNLSRAGSVSDVSSLDASHSSNTALSHSQLYAANSAKSYVNDPTANNKPSGANISKVSQKMSAPRGSVGGRNVPPLMARKASLTTAKRPSVVDVNVPSTQQDPTGVRRASVATTGLSGNVGANRLTLSTSAAGSSSRASTNRRIVAADSTASKPVALDAGRLKPSHRPDVVSNSVLDEHSSNKIARLEALHETKTKELNATQNELNEKIKWFEAMAVVAKHFVSQLKCGSCEKLTIRLEEAAEKLNGVESQLDVLAEQRDSLICEIENIKQKGEQEREKLRLTYEERLKQRELDLIAKREEEIERVTSEHSKHIAGLETAYDEQLAALHKEYSQELADKEVELDVQLEQLKLEQDMQLTELKSQHENKLVEITERCEMIKQSLAEQLEFLRAEKEDLRRRESLYMEECQQKAEVMIQSSLGPYRQEIESMKAVIELRNTELRDMRLHNMELQRQMEELSSARETIKRLQQKVENLEAVVNIRADYEKQLTEKHQQLLRKYEHETKANKRLSMDKEELMWRLAQGDVTPEPPRRSLSHSPTAVDHHVSGGAGTKLFTIPDTSLKSENTSPAGASTPNSTTSTSLVKLRRSGTYDLLSKTDSSNEVFD